MFVDVLLANFEADGFKAQFISDKNMPIESFRAIAMKCLEYCDQREKEAEFEEPAAQVEEMKAPVEEVAKEEVAEEVKEEVAKEELVEA